MSDPFVDEPLPGNIQGMPCRVNPRFSTRISVAKSGSESRNRNWINPLRRFALPEAVTTQDQLESVLDHWTVMGGPFQSWPFRDPTDFASCPLDDVNTVPDITGLDQPLGEGDGTTYQFQLVKQRVLGSGTITRTISLPIISSVIIFIDGVLPSAVPSGHGGPYTVTSITRPGGLVTISPIPTVGRVLTSGFLFDTEVRYEADDTLDNIVHSLDTVGAAEIDLVEVRRCC